MKHQRFETFLGIENSLIFSTFLLHFNAISSANGTLRSGSGTACIAVVVPYLYPKLLGSYLYVLKLYEIIFFKEIIYSIFIESLQDFEF